MFQDPIEYLMTVSFAACSVTIIYLLNRIFGTGRPTSLSSILTQFVCYLPPNLLLLGCAARIVWGGFAHLINSIGL